MGNAAKSHERTTIQDYLLSKEYIEANNIARDLIFEIQIEDNHIGPFLNSDLKDFLADANLYLEETMVKCIDDDQWTSVYNHPYFQRRRPSLVSTKELGISEDEFIVLRDGKKEGPFSKQQLQTMLSSHEVLPIDYVSVDKGASWGKIYETEGFDRRHRDNESLPTTPEGHIFTNSATDADRALSIAITSANEKDAIVGLAYIGHLNDGKKKHHIDEIKVKKQNNEESESEKNKLTRPIQSLLLGVLILGGIFYINQTKNSEELDRFNAPEANTQEPTKKIVHKKAQEITPPPRAQVKREPAVKKLEVTQGRSVTRSNESIRDAEFLKKKLSEGEIYEAPPEAIFDDATEAVELDPIRQRISKDTIDPELESLEGNIPAYELDEISRSLGPIDEFGNALDENLDASNYDQ